MHVIVKKSPHRVDPRSPQSTDPRYERDRKIGERRMREGKLTFANAHEEKEYWKAVESNPINVPGLPAFAPPLQIKSYVPINFKDTTVRELNVGLPRTIELYCENCQRPKRSEFPVSRVTPHQISKTGSFCKLCGKEKPYHV